jgi:hypothetical protein
MRIDFGSSLRCEGADAGTVADVVVDPAERRLTHVVVEVRDDVARLVPAALLAPGHDGGIVLGCTLAELRALDPVGEVAYLPVDEFPEADDTSDVGIEDVMSVPSYQSIEFGDYADEFTTGLNVRYDRIPKGEVELRGASDVVSPDGSRRGSLHGIVVDGTSLTHVVVRRGHLWWKRDDSVAIGAVESFATDCVTLARPA